MEAEDEEELKKQMMELEDPENKLDGYDSLLHQNTPTSTGLNEGGEHDENGVQEGVSSKHEGKTESAKVEETKQEMPAEDQSERKDTDGYNLAGNVDYTWLVKNRKNALQDKQILSDRSPDSMLDNQTV